MDRKDDLQDTAPTLSTDFEERMKIILASPELRQAVIDDYARKDPEGFRVFQELRLEIAKLGERLRKERLRDEGLRKRRRSKRFRNSA